MYFTRISAARNTRAKERACQPAWRCARDEDSNRVFKAVTAEDALFVVVPHDAALVRNVAAAVA